MILGNVSLAGKQSSIVCRSAYVEIRRIISIRYYLTVEATEVSFVPSFSPT